MITRPFIAALAAISFVACQSSTPPDRFAQADIDGNNTLNEAEVTAYLVGGIFGARDTDKDGKISKAEWNPQMDATEALEFGKRDGNGDGVVTREEATAYALKAGVYAGDLRGADTNKDGVVSRDEVLAYYASKE